MLAARQGKARQEEGEGEGGVKGLELGEYNEKELRSLGCT